MEVTETTADGLKRELKVVIDAKDLDRRLSERLKELKDQVRIKGFRPGKVPVTHLRKVYGRSVMAEVMQQVVSETSQQALNDRSERPAFQPDIELPEDGEVIEKVIAGDADLAYTMSFEVLPEIEIEDFSKIKLEKQYSEVDEKDIESGVEKMVDGAITYEPKKGAAKDGDQVTLDYKGEMGGEPFEGGEAEGAAVVLGRGSFIPGFEEALKGAKAGDSLKVETAFPKDYPAEQLAGQDVVFAIDVAEVAKPVRPKIDEAFAKTMGFEKIDKLREAVKIRLADELETASRTKLKRLLLDRLDEAYNFDLPQKLVDNEFETIWRQVTSDL
jgi:trigger factor